MGFISALASYLVVFLVFVAVIAVAVFLGITLRKKKDGQDTDSTSSTTIEG